MFVKDTMIRATAPQPARIAGSGLVNFMSRTQTHAAIRRKTASHILLSVSKVAPYRYCSVSTMSPK